eukprot:522871-Amorphochlora_amoeboformis.AAC.2
MESWTKRKGADSGPGLQAHRALMNGIGSGEGKNGACSSKGTSSRATREPRSQEGEITSGGGQEDLVGSGEARSLERPQGSESRALEASRMTDKTQMFNLDSLQPLQNDDALQRRIHELCGARFNPRRRRMPGPLPQPVTRANLRLLRSEDYWVAEKSDGDRYMLFYASSGHQRGCYLIGRKTLLLRIPGTFFNEMFGHHDCLLDGELVYETQNDVKRHAYLVFDAVTYNGRNVGDQKLADRLKLVSEVVGKYRRHEKITSPPFAMQSKVFPFTFVGLGL